MFKRIFALLFVIFCIQQCSNPQAPSDDPPVTSNPAVQNVVNERNRGNPDADTIVTRPRVDTGTAVDSTTVEFYVNTGRGLGKVLAKFTSLRNYRQDSVKAITLDFASLDSKDTVSYNFPMVNGVCKTTSVKVPSNHTYETLVKLWCIPVCPFSGSNYSIFDPCFAAVDTINVKSGIHDTLNLVFYELMKIKFFLALKMPVGGNWTEGKSYLAYVGSKLSTPVLYKNGTLWGYYVMNNLTSRTTQMSYFSSDTDTILVSFIPDVMSMLVNNGVVTVSADSVFYGIHESHEDSLLFVPMDNRPEHPKI